MQKKDRLIEILAAGEIDDVAALNQKLNDINKRVGDLEQKRRRTERGNLAKSLKICDVVDDLNRLPQTLKGAPAQGKGEILRQFVSRIVFREDYVDFEWQQPFSILMQPTLLQLPIMVTKHSEQDFEQLGVREFHGVCAQRDSNSRPLDS